MAINSTHTTEQHGSLAKYGAQTLWLPVLALICFGLLFVYSSSGIYASEKYGNEFIFVKKQILYVFPGIAAAMVGAKISLKWVQKHAGYFFSIGIIAVLLTKAPIIGKKVGGAARWLNLGGLQLQPSEFLKIACILFCAKLLVEKPMAIWRTGICAIGFLALLFQPDFGSALILLCGIGAILLLHGVPKRIFLGILMLGIPSVFIMMIAAPYRVRRLVTFLDPYSDPLGAGFQVIQSFVAIASGGLFGKGLGGSQQKLFFLPEAHTDFILSVISEEMGFTGVATICLIFFLLFFSISQIIANASTHYERLTSAGILAMLGSSCVVNMGVVAGLLPTKGLPLPFISAGGSALIANMFLVGLLSQFHKNAILHQTQSNNLRTEQKDSLESSIVQGQ